jgi:HAMP domain-containing protein/putative methionine-R-sulfoxide reductase with GAF domain
MTTQDQAAPRRLSWRHLSIRNKLLIPIVSSFVVSMILLFVFITPSLRNFAEQQQQVAFSYRLEDLDHHLADVLSTARPSLLSVVNQPETVAILDTLPGIGDNVRVPLENSFRDMLNVQVSREVHPESVRILRPDGHQLAVAQFGRNNTDPVMVSPAKLVSEADEPYFKQLGKVTAGTAQLLPPHLATEKNSDGHPELVIELGTAVYSKGNVLGYVIVGIYTRDLLPTVLDAQPSDHFQILLYDNDNTLMAATNATNGSGRIFVETDPELAQFTLPSTFNLKTNQVATTLGDRILSSHYTQDISGFNGVGWTIVINESAADAFAPLQNVFSTLVILLVVVMVLVFVIVFFLSRGITQPLTQLSQAAERVAAGDFKAKLRVTTEDEVGTMAIALNSMSTRMNDLVSDLERRVVERTRNIEIVAEISRDAAQLREIDALLQRTVNAIRERFNFYHAQVFLVDDARQFAVLVTSTGEAGRILLARNHKLAIGSDSIVGQVAEKGRTFITLDTEKSEVQWRFNPVLPETRSEMAMPLRLAGVVIGALDIQSKGQDAFSRADVEVFEVLADQLAIAIDNARLIRETERRIQQIDDLNRRLTRDAWSEYTRRRSSDVLSYQ